MLLTLKETDFILSQISLEDEKLSLWEVDFLRNVKGRRAQGFDISDKQIKTVSAIWDRIGD